MKVEVVDHLIVIDKVYYSSVDSGVFELLQESKKWVLPFELEEIARDKGREESIEIGKKKGKIKRKSH